MDRLKKDHTVDFDQLLNMVMSSVTNVTWEPDAQDVCYAILCKHVGGPPFKEKILNGTYLNSLNSITTPFVPTLSLFQLYCFGKQGNTDLQVATAKLVEKDWKSDFCGDPFELFHLYYERLRQTAIRSLATVGDGSSGKKTTSNIISYAEYYGPGKRSILNL